MYDANGHKFKMITYANIPLVIGRAAPAKASAVNKARAVGLIPDSLVYDTPFRNKFIPDWELMGVPGQTIYDYCGNIVYKNGVPTIYREDGFTTLARMRFPEFHYYIRDHQGNIRGVTDGRGNIEQQNDYYPFGGMMASSTGGAVQPYRYTGKELVRFQGLDWLDYGARWYDPAILHWNGVDELAEKYHSVSPYMYCLDNPIRYVDLDGKDIYIYFTGKDGKTYTYRFNGNKDENIPNNSYVRDFISAYNFNIKNGGGDNLKEAACNPNIKIYVSGNSEENHFVSGRKPTVYWKSRQGLKTTDGKYQSPATVLEHEFDHAVDNYRNHRNHLERSNEYDKQYDNKEERRVITGSETKTAKANRESVRYNHRGKPYRTAGPTSTVPIIQY